MHIVVDTNKLHRIGVPPQTIKKIIEGAQVEGDDATKYRNRVPIGEAARMIGTGEQYLRDLASHGKFPHITGPRDGKGFDVGEAFRLIWQLVTGSNVEQDIKKERLRKLEIENQVRIGELIPRNEAEDRMVVLLRAIQRMFLMVTKSCAPLLRGCGSSAEVEKIIISQYKEFFNVLEKQCIKVEWYDKEESKKKIKIRKRKI